MKPNRAYINDLARQRILRLFALAVETIHTDPALANRYVEIALRISMRTRVRIPKELKRNLCRGCNSLLYPGITSRVRISASRSPHLSVTCLNCGSVRRYVLNKRR
ncbi:MAG: ribonuclease P [Candidatus Verstraetearchaeota archaeon]|nr:ribonuclease P [Candidatus Verstraetearchaeota archaeon]